MNNAHKEKFQSEINKKKADLQKVTAVAQGKVADAKISLNKVVNNLQEKL